LLPGAEMGSGPPGDLASTHGGAAAHQGSEFQEEVLCEATACSQLISDGCVQTPKTGGVQTPKTGGVQTLKTGGVQTLETGGVQTPRQVVHGA